VIGAIGNCIQVLFFYIAFTRTDRLKYVRM
jgi:hypothetical protein